MKLISGLNWKATGMKYLCPDQQTWCLTLKCKAKCLKYWFLDQQTLCLVCVVTHQVWNNGAVTNEVRSELQHIKAEIFVPSSPNLKFDLSSNATGLKYLCPDQQTWCLTLNCKAKWLKYWFRDQQTLCLVCAATHQTWNSGAEANEAEVWSNLQRIKAEILVPWPTNLMPDLSCNITGLKYWCPDQRIWFPAWALTQHSTH